MSDENNMFENNDQQKNETQVENNSYSYESQPAGNNYSYEPSGNDYGSGKGQSTGLGIASMVCGIVAIPIMCCTNVGSVLSIILGIVAVVLGIVQIVKNEKKGMAIAGIVCGAIAVIVCVSLVIFGAYLLSSGLYDEIMNYNYSL